MKHYKGNNISNLVIIVLIILVVSLFTSCATEKRWYNNSGEKCQEHHRPFKTFKA